MGGAQQSRILGIQTQHGNHICRKTGTVWVWTCHDGYGNVPGKCDLPRGYSQYMCTYFVTMDYGHVTENLERKIDCLKKKSEGEDSEAPTCVVPIHAPQTNSRWQGVEEVNSACEVGC